MKKLQILLSALLLSASVQAQQYPFQNPNLPARERAEDLCKRLTLEEKASLMQNNSPAIGRLGIPRFEWWNEALHGVGRNGTATVFPITMGMAASWDDDLLLRVFTAVSNEARAKNTLARRNAQLEQYRGLSFWTPNINIFRDPRWGRGQETYGEDPYLTAVMGRAVVNGLQGQDSRGRALPGSRYRKLLACAKHFAVHSGPEWSRHQMNIESLSPRDLYETYLPAFKSLVQDAHVAEVMCAYQRFEGQPCCGSNKLLQQILREEWHFGGLVTSDCGAISDFWEPGRHEYVKTAREASAKAVAVGTDVECGNVYASLPQAVRDGLVSEKQIDKSLKRLLQARIELGDFDPDSLVSWTRIPASCIACNEHRELALQMARESITLLQNRGGILPLPKNAGLRIAVVGNNAVDSTMQWGNYNGFPRHTVTILDAIRRQGNYVNFVACPLTEPQEPAAITAQVRNADVVIFVGGISPRLEGEEMPVNVDGFRGGDRTDIELPATQRAVIKALHEAGKKVVYVNCSGSAIGLVPESEHADAILQAWYPGEKGGQAVAEVLFGDCNPSGKLPVTFYRDASQLPDFSDYSMRGRTYRYFTGRPLYPFGFGLSYTTFAYGKPRYAQGTVTVAVTNTGQRAGDEIVQVYIRRPADRQGPIKSLRGFTRVSLKAGETKTVTIPMPRERFENWDETTNTMRVVSGKYTVMVGSSSAESDLQSINVTIK